MSFACVLKRLSLAVAAIVAACSFFVPSSSAQGEPPAFTTTNTIRFLTTTYFADEDSLLAQITVVRDGSLTNGDPVSVEYTMVDGSAVSGVHYFRFPGTIVFPPGEDRAVFNVPLIDNFAAGGPVSLGLTLRNPGSGTTTFAELGEPNMAMLVIQDDETTSDINPAGEVEIAPGNYFGSYLGTAEEWNTQYNVLANFTPYGPGGIQVTIVRKGGSRGKILVDWQTTTNITPVYEFSTISNIFGIEERSGGTAIPFEDFIPTNGTVALDDFQMSTNIVLPLTSTFQANSGGDTNIAPAPFTFGVELTGVRAAPEEAGMDVNPTLGDATLRPVLVTLIDRDFAFKRIHYTVSEGQRFVHIRVRRSQDDQGSLGPVTVRYVVNPLGPPWDNDHLNNLFQLEPGSEYSTPFIDYEPPNTPMWSDTMAAERAAGRPRAQDDAAATLSWGDGDVTDRYIIIPVNNDDEPEFNEDMRVVLYKLPTETDGRVHPYARIATVKIHFDDQPAGASETTFNPDNNALTEPPYMTTPGANNTVQAVAAQPDGKVVIGGDFTSVNTVSRLGIARLNFDGSTDPTFNPGTGVSGFVRAVALQTDGKILVGGGFDSVNGIPRFGIARLLTNGVVDTTFNPGIGVDSPVRTIALQEDGKILIGGEFLSVNGTNRTYIARLESNGQLDTTFDPGPGPDGPVNSIAVSAGVLDIDRFASGGPAEDRFTVDTGSSEGAVTVNYDFLNVPDTLRIYHEGQIIYDSGLINGSGSVTVNYGPGTSTYLDIVMNEGSGLSGTIWVYDLQINPVVDPRPVIGGEFTSYGGTPMNFIARLNLDGTLDSGFNPGTGANDVVYAVAKQGNKAIMAGDFTSVDLRSRRGVARLNEDGSLDTLFDPGTGFDNSVYTVAVQPTGKPVLGGLFTTFNSTRRVGMARLNLDGTLDTSFMDTAKNQFAGVPIPLSAENVQGQENFIRSLSHYRLTNITIMTNLVVDTNNVTNEVTVTNIALSDHLFAGGRFTRFGGGFRRDDIRSRLNIARIVGGATPGPGNISFAYDSYSVDENAGQTFITLVRTNGSLAPVSAQFEAKDRPPGGPGISMSGVDYESLTTFPFWIRSHDADRQFSDAFMGPNNNAFSTNRRDGDFTIYPPFARPGFRYSNYDEDNIFVSILDDNLIEGDEVLDMTLSQPVSDLLLLGGEPIPVGTALGKTYASLTIADNDFDFGTLGFSEPEYFVNENGVDAVVTITRVGGSSGAVTVDVVTQDGTANIGDYSPIARRTIFFANGQTTNRFTIRLKNDVVAELEETVLLTLDNATGFPGNVAPERRLDPERSTAVLNIIDDDFAPGRLSFSQPTFTAVENDGQVVVTVRRSGGNFSELFVNFATGDGTAIAGIDYASTNGILHWVDGDSAAKTFTIPLFDNEIVEGEKTINITLSNPSNPEALGAQPTAVVRISNDDAFGTFSFSQPAYSVDENGPYADITVLRLEGLSGTVQVSFGATNLTAVGATNMIPLTNGVPDFIFTNGVLTFAPGESSKSFRVRVMDDPIVEGDKQVALSLFDPQLGLGGLTNAVLTIIDNELNKIPAGSVDTTFLAKGTDDFIYTLALQQDSKILLGGDFKFINDVVRNRLGRLNADGTLDPTFDPVTGPNNSVRALDLQENSRLFIAGLFSSVGGTNRSHLARLNIDSNVDPTYNPGASTDNPIYAMVEQPDRKVVIVGDFSTYRGVDRRGIARTTTNGFLDITFDPGTGANGTVYSVALQPDGKILIGGDFTTFNEVSRNRLVRLNRDGSIDTTFAAEGGANGSVRTIFVQNDGKILIGGLFTTVHGQTLNRLARLNANGTVDTSFNVGSGADGAVNVVTVQLDGKLLVGGDFTTFNNRSRNRITRLNADGTLDPTINFGAGFNATVSSIVVQPDRRILIAGGFTQYDGQAAQRIVRIHGGSIAGEGRIQFTSPFFRSSESGTNALVTVRRTGGTTGEISVNLRTIAASATAGVDFSMITTNLLFPEAETFRTVLIPVFDDALIESDEIVNLELSNIGGGNVLGAQPNATLTIESDDSQIEFSSAAYSVTENFVTGSASITLRRLGSTALPTTVTFVTSDGTATGGSDYTAVSNTVTFARGEVSRTFTVPILDDTIVEGDETLLLTISNLVGRGIINGNTSVLTIVDNDFAAGQLSFSAEKFSGAERTGQIVVTVRRTAGTTGVVSVDYATSGLTATPRADYNEARGIVSFADGETTKNFIIELFDDLEVEGNEDILVTISNPAGGATIIGSTEATATIVDDDLGPGSLDQNFDPGTGANGPVRVVKLDDLARIYIGGGFTQYDSTNRSRIARLVFDGELDSSFDPGVGPNGVVADIEFVSTNSIQISGGFNTVGGVLHNRVARLDINGNLDPSFNLPLGLNAEVSDLEIQPDGKVVIGGLFDIASAAGRNRIARLNADGTVDVSFDPGFGADNTVHAVALQPDGKILIGGSFGSVNGNARRGIARLNANGSIDTSFNVGGGANGAVRDILLLSNGKIMIAGDFTMYNGVTQNRVARLNANGTLDNSFNPGGGPNGIVYALALQPDGKFFIAGNFTAVAGVPRVRVARLNVNGSLDATFNPGDGPNDEVYSIVVQPLDGKVLIGGRFTMVDRVSRNGIARFNNDPEFLGTVEPILFSSVSRTNGGSQISLATSTQPGFTYVLESSDDLNSWITVQSFTATEPTTELIEAIDNEHRFFRIRRVAP